MTSFQISVTPSRRAAARLVARVRREIQKALAEEARASGLNQSEIARRIGVHRSVINRELRGVKDMTIGRVGELGWAMGREAMFALPEIKNNRQSNMSSQSPVVCSEQTVSGTLATVRAADQTMTTSAAKSANVRIAKIVEPA